MGFLTRELGRPSAALIFLTFLSYCSTSGFNGNQQAATERNDKQKNLSANDVDGADGADGTGPQTENEADDTDDTDDPKNDVDDPKKGGKDGGDEESGDFEELEEFLKDCRSFNGDNTVKVAIPGGPDVKIDLRDYDEGGQIRENEETGGLTYIFHMRYYRLKNASSGKPKFARDVHDPDYDEVMYRGLIDFASGLNLADESDCKTRAYELTQTKLQNKFETRDNFNGGCFDPDVRIRLADGSDKRIADFTGSESVLNPVTGKKMAVKRLIMGPEKHHALVEVTHGGKSVQVTTEHPFLTDRGLLAAKELTASTKLVGKDGTYTKIERLRRLNMLPGQLVYNLTLDAGNNLLDHMVLANGVVTGDLFLQEKLAEKTPKVAKAEEPKL